MEKERKFRNVLLIVLCVTVFCMSVGFAYMSQLLTINGTLNVTKPTWDIHFASITPSTPAAGNHAVDNSHALSNSDHTATFDLTMTAPGDTLTYTLVITNAGTLDAKVNAITVAPTSGSKIDAENNITVTTTGVAANDVLIAGGTATLVITFTYDSDATTFSNTTTTPYTYTATVDYAQVHA